MKIKNSLKLLACIIGCELAGIAGSFFTIASIPTWYVTLEKPFLNPPSWVFGPVWTTLYFLMGVSLYLILQNKNKIRKGQFKNALIIFGLQLFLNATWSLVFFGMQNIGLALINIFLLFVAIFFTILKFNKINKVSAYILTPYILWVGFATYLNFAIWIIN